MGDSGCISDYICSLKEGAVMDQSIKSAIIGPFGAGCEISQESISGAKI
jgi:hypothetical protein